jgi:hypothetical protein
MGQIFKRAERYLDKIDAGIFVEIGSSRDGDDGSTAVIASWAQQRSQPLVTVDFDPAVCKALEGQALSNVSVVNSTGEDYLRSYAGAGPISFLYLDNFDWDWHPINTEAFVLEQQVRYKQLGRTMTNLTSQMAHLNQAILAMPYMALRSLIVCDDTWYNEHWGHYSGKSGAAVPYLIGHGYRILETEEQPVYGTILGRW